MEVNSVWNKNVSAVYPVNDMMAITGLSIHHMMSQQRDCGRMAIYSSEAAGTNANMETDGSSRWLNVKET